jgi:hypothetical protein
MAEGMFQGHVHENHFVLCRIRPDRRRRGLSDRPVREVLVGTSQLPVFLGCFFLVFWIAWRLAVKGMEPQLA